MRARCAAAAAALTLAGCGGPTLEIAEIVPCPVELVTLDVPDRPVLVLDDARRADSAAYQRFVVEAEAHMDGRDRQDAARLAQVRDCLDLAGR